MTAGTRAGASRHWREHFGQRHRRAAAGEVAGSLDYSNERVRLQTYASLIEGVGRLAGARALDAGCGWGALALALHGCGAEVTALDLVPETISELERRYPFISWRVADLGRLEEVGDLGPFDAIVAAEVLQYVDFATALGALWQLLAPGGRLVAAVPNADCPIVRRVARRDEHWVPVSEEQVRAAASGLDELSELRLRGLDFQEDQSFLPYRSSEWASRLAGTPNRIVLALVRGGGAGG